MTRCQKNDIKIVIFKPTFIIFISSKIFYYYCCYIIITASTENHYLNLNFTTSTLPQSCQPNYSSAFSSLPHTFS